MVEEVTKRTNNIHGILLNPKTVLDIEKLKEKGVSDEFGFSGKINDFVNYVTEYLGDNESLVVGIYGDYGSGKSVFVNLLENKVKHTKTKFITFHAWKYKDEKSILRNFILYLSEKINNEKEHVKLRDSIYYTDEKIKTQQKEIWYSLMGLFLISVVLSIWLQKPYLLLSYVFPSIATVFLIYKYHSIKQTRQPISQIEEFETEFEKLLTKNNNEYDKIYIVIENIDRCLPHHAIILLESLNTFFEISERQKGKPQCIFIIPCDKNVLETAIMNEGGVSKEGAASAYLDKLIQLPYDLPVCCDEDWQSYVKSLLNQKKKKIVRFNCGMKNEIKKKLFSEWVIDLLQLAEISNPREIKMLLREWEMRFINLSIELKSNEEQNLKSALILLKLLVLKNRGLIQGPYPENIYESLMIFSKYFESKVTENYKRSKQILDDFMKNKNNVEKTIRGVERPTIATKLSVFNNESYAHHLKNYINEYFDQLRSSEYVIDRDEFFIYITIHEIPVLNRSSFKSKQEFLCIFENEKNITIILDTTTESLFDYNGVLGKSVHMIGRRSNLSAPSVSKRSSNLNIEKLMSNEIRPASFEDLKKFMLTTNSLIQNRKRKFLSGEKFHNSLNK